MRLLAQLKHHTADAHAALESRLNVFEQVRTRDDYRRLLARFFTLHEPIEARLANAADWPALGFDFSARRKAALLRDDLRALGASETDLAALPRAHDLPAVATLAEAIGCLYVLEGSTLGGQILSKHFQTALGLTPETGARFFHGYGAQTGARWREFGLWAEAQSESANEDFEADAAHGARQTFHTFAQWLTP